MEFGDLRALTKSAEICKKRAQEIAATRSRRIPIATHVQVRGLSVAVVTEGFIAPNAAPFEAAELHPLWAKVGSWRYLHYKWGRQPYFPYMLMAAEETLDDMARGWAESVYQYGVKLGFK